MNLLFSFCFKTLLCILSFSTFNVFAQIERVEQHILNQQFDSAKIELARIPASNYTKSLHRIARNKENEKDILAFVFSADLFGEIQYKKLNKFIQNKVPRPSKENQINLNYVLIKWQQINHLRNELSVEDATKENIELKKYIATFDQSDKNVQKANIYLNIHEIVLYLIQGEIDKGKNLCQKGLTNAIQLKDTNLILTTKYYLSNVLMSENRLDEYIENCKESIEIENKLSHLSLRLFSVIKFCMFTLKKMGHVTVKYTLKGKVLSNEEVEKNKNLFNPKCFQSKEKLDAILTLREMDSDYILFIDENFEMTNQLALPPSE